MKYVCVISTKYTTDFPTEPIIFPYRYIVDSGFVKQLNHNSRVGMDILEVVPISK